MALTHNFHCFLPEIFLLQQEHDLVEAESLITGHYIFGAQEIKDLIVSAYLDQVIEIQFGSVLVVDLALLDHVKGVELAASCNFLTDRNVRTEMSELSNLREVELEGQALSAVGFEPDKLALHKLGLLDWHRANRDLVQQIELSRVRRDICHDDLALVGHVHKELGRDGIIIV